VSSIGEKCQTQIGYVGQTGCRRLANIAKPYCPVWNDADQYATDLAADQEAEEADKAGGNTPVAHAQYGPRDHILTPGPGVTTQP
jgi:hypothetical protein